MDHETVEMERIKKIKNWFNGKNEMPSRIHLNTTSKCNLRCKFCWQSTDKKNINLEEIPKNRIPILIKEAKELGVLEWQLSGNGEPFCRLDFTLSTMKEIKKYGMYGNVITNGTMLNRKIIEDIVHMGWDYLMFSIDGPNAEIHDELRGVPGTFEKVIQNIMTLVETKKSLNSNWPDFSITTVINKKNYDKINEMINLAHTLGGDGLTLNMMVDYGVGTELKLNENEIDEFKKNIEKNIELIKKLNLNTNFSMFLEKNEDKKEKKIINPKCYEPWYNLAIDVSGNVGPCCERFNEKGQENIKNKSLREIWFGEYFEKLREDMINGNLNKVCMNCPLWHQNLANKIKTSLI